MHFSKPATTFESQAELLLRRGIIGDKQFIISKLQSVSYYRFCGYLYPFRMNDPNDKTKKLETYYPGTTIEEVWDRYVFDRQLRVLTMDAIERIEVDIRTKLAYYHSHKHGPFAYIDNSKLPGLVRPDEWARFLGNIEKQFEFSEEVFIKSYKQKYSNRYSPVWMAVELMDFGTMFTFFRGCESNIKTDISNVYGVTNSVMESWLRSLNMVRNICAHHSRMWNRVFGVRPLIPSRDAKWGIQGQIGNDRVFAVLSVCKYCLDIIAPQSHWKSRLSQLFSRHPNIPTKDMGFPVNWQQIPIWLDI